MRFIYSLVPVLVHRYRASRRFFISRSIVDLTARERYILSFFSTVLTVMTPLPSSTGSFNSCITNQSPGLLLDRCFPDLPLWIFITIEPPHPSPIDSLSLSTSPLPLLLLLPLFGRQTLWRPGMNGGNLLLERAIDEAMARQQRLLLKVGRHNHRRKGLAAPAGHVLDGDVRRLQGLFEFAGQRFRRDLVGSSRF